MIVLTNIGELGVGGTIAAGIAKLYIPSLSLRALKEVKDADPALIQRVQKAIQSRIDNKPDSELITPQLVQAISTQRSRRANDRVAAFGSIKKLSFVGEENTDGKKTHLFLADTGRRLFLWRIAFDEKSMISEMTLEEEE